MSSGGRACWMPVHSVAETTGSVRGQGAESAAFFACSFAVVALANAFIGGVAGVCHGGRDYLDAGAQMPCSCFSCLQDSTLQWIHWFRGSGIVDRSFPFKGARRRTAPSAAMDRKDPGPCDPDETAFP